jgi:hypothetical protein
MSTVVFEVSSVFCVVSSVFCVVSSVFFVVSSIFGVSILYYISLFFYDRKGSTPSVLLQIPD